MDRHWDANGAAGAPAAPVNVLGPNVYPQGGFTPSEPGPWWYHMITEEIRKVITDAAMTPDRSDPTQLSAAIQRMIAGGDYKASVRAATTANLAALSGLLTIDGVVLAAGDRVLVKDQAAAAENGIYVAAAGAWARAEDGNTAGDLTSGVLVPVESGTENADTVWMLVTDGAIIIGATALTWQIKSMTKGVQRFTSNGSFTVPAGVSTIYVSGCAGGGGGGGGGGTTTTSGSGCGGGGGAGQPIVLQPYAVTPGQIISISIGGAGSPGAGGGAGIFGDSGTAGGNTVIGSLTTLTGGAGGSGGGQASTGTYGAGGAGGVGYPTGAYGGDGGAGSTGGAGASGPYGGGGGAGRSGSDAGFAASSAFGFGAGGSGGGGVWQSAGAGAAGSAGAPGLVIIEW